MKEAFDKILKFLEKVAGEEGMASVQINNEGTVILRYDATGEEFMSLDDFAKEVDK